MRFHIIHVGDLYHDGFVPSGGISNERHDAVDLHVGYWISASSYPNPVQIYTSDSVIESEADLFSRSTYAFSKLVDVIIGLLCTKVNRPKLVNRSIHHPLEGSGFTL